MNITYPRDDIKPVNRSLDLNIFLFYRIKMKNSNQDVLLRKVPFSCDETSRACPPCVNERIDRRRLMSKTSFNGKYGKCSFNGTVFTIPQSPSANNLDGGFYSILAKESINVTTFVTAILEDAKNKNYNVR